MPNYLPRSLFVVATGAINSGKTYQIHSILIAEVHGEHFALPCAFIAAESSSEGTAAEVMLDPGAAVVWRCSTCEQAMEALLALFPESGPLTLGAAKQAAYKVLLDRAAKSKDAPRPEPPVPHQNDSKVLRALAIDTASTLYNGSEKAAYRQFLEAAGGKAGVKPGGKGAEYNDPRESHKMAAKRCGDMLDRINGIAMAHQGLVVLVTCHTGPAMQATGQPGQSVCVGEAPMLGSPKEMAAGIDVPGFSRTWDQLAAKANVVVHCFETVPEYRGGNGTLDDINARARAADRDNTAQRGVITHKGKYPGLGPVLWVKRQGGDGPLGVFAQLPAYWHPNVPGDPGIDAITPTPNLGKVLAYAIEQHVDAMEQAAETSPGR